jgi:hypothetical protein
MREWARRESARASWAGGRPWMATREVRRSAWPPTKERAAKAAHRSTGYITRGTTMLPTTTVRSRRAERTSWR